MCESNNNVSEAYKAVIDFNKVIISIASTILAAEISFIVFKDTSFIWSNFLSALVLVMTIIFSFLGFGKSILSVKTEKSNKRAILFTNLGVYGLIVGILLIALIRPQQNKTIDQILNEISVNTFSLEFKLAPTHCKKLTLSEKEYIIEYVSSNSMKKVIYSIEKNKIVSIE